jgi:predicted nucleic acid-binding protein
LLYFLDSSACVKLYLNEVGTTWLRALVAARDLVVDLPIHEFIITRITVVETAATLYRRAHKSTGDFAEARAGVASLERDSRDLFRLIEMSPALVSAALDVAARRGLRAYDCLQLGGALLAHQARLAVGPPNLRFVCADLELNAAAESEGLTVINPKDRPTAFPAF